MATILNITGGMSPNAAEPTVLKFSRYFDGHETTTVFFSEPDDRVSRIMDDYGLTHQYLRGSLKRSTLRLARHLASNHQQYDVIHLYGSPVNHGPAAALASKLTDTPIISRFNGYNRLDGPVIGHLTSAIEHDLLRNSEGVVFNSSPQMMDLLDAHGLKPADNHHVIPPGVNADWFFPAPTEQVQDLRRDLGIGKDTVVLGAVMTPRPIKRVDRMFDIIESLSETRDVVLVIVGDSDYVPQYKTDAIERGIADLVVWPGQIHASQLYRHYSLFDVTILTSDRESFGLSITESYLCETPCVAYDTGGMREQIRHEETGYLASERDVEEFVQYLESLLDDEGKQQEFAANGKQYVRERFTLDEAQSKYHELLAAVV